MAHDVRNPHIFQDGPGNTASGEQVMDNCDALWLAADAAQAVPGGFNAAGVVRRGKSIIATSESRTNVAYGLLTTPDRVQSVVLPTDGLLRVGYQATWQASAASGSGQAAIFIGANQLKIAQSAQAAPVVQEASSGASNAIDYPLSSTAVGLESSGGATGTNYGSDVTTGQIVGVAGNTRGGPVWIFAAAGTYDISVQFKATSGSVTVKNRKLWVWTLGF